MAYGLEQRSRDAEAVMAGKMILYKLVVLGDGGVGKVRQPNQLLLESKLTFVDGIDNSTLPSALR